MGRVIHIPPGPFRKPETGFYCEPCEILFGRKTVIEVESDAKA